MSMIWPLTDLETDMNMVGVDISKATFDAALPLGADKYRTRGKISNTLAGHDEFVDWLGTYAPHAAVGMEATGAYHEALADRLVAEGVVVYVINPAQIAAFAKSELGRTKSDRVDAKRIARFCLAQQASGSKLHRYVPLPPAQRTLKALVLRLEDLKSLRQMERNRRETARPAVHPSIDAVIAACDTQITTLEKAIRQHIDDHPDLRGGRDLLNSIPGISDTTSAWLIAYLGDMRQFQDVREVVAFVGIDPRIRESGTWKGHTRISKCGHASLRAKLYLPAVVARTHNPIIKTFCARLAARGKPGLVITVAAMRKLIHIAWGVLRSGRPFDPSLALAG
jgi:transposase